MILVDTNTWVFFLNGRRPTRLAEFLRSQRVRTCDVVIGELSLGAGLPPEFRTHLASLARLPTPTPAETLAFIQRHTQLVCGSGVGWADMQVIHTAEQAGALLYTEDEAMRSLWLALGFRLADGGPRLR